MARPASSAILSGIIIDRSNRTTITNQLFAELRQAIITGRIEGNFRMPSSRALARDLDLSRTTVINVYEQLKVEGYLIGKEKLGTFTNPVLPDLLADRAESAPKVPRKRKPAPPVLANRLSLDELASPSDETAFYPFNPAIPAIDAFPTAKFARIQRKATLNLANDRLMRAPLLGHAELRKQVAHYASVSRGVHCTADQVMLLTGTRQSLLLPLFGLSNPGDGVWVEDPGYPAGPAAFRLMRLKTIPVPVDDEGMIVSEARAHHPDARFAYVTPARQYPTGTTMSIERRLELLSWANETGGWIIEDDYDGEYRFALQPSAALQSLDREGRVIYVGTFSKTLLPTLSLGYLIAPEPLVPVFSKLLNVMSRPPDLSLQMTIAEFMQNGSFASHVRKMRTLYHRRQNALITVLNDMMGDLMRAESLNAGLHLIGKLPPRYCEKTVAKHAERSGLLPRPFSNYTLARRSPNALLLGFAGLPQHEMEPAVALLRQAILDAG